MDVEGILAELRKELDAIEAAILSLERLCRSATLRPDRRLDRFTRSRTEGANGFDKNPEPVQISKQYSPGSNGGRQISHFRVQMLHCGDREVPLTLSVLAAPSSKERG